MEDRTEAIQQDFEHDGIWMYFEVTGGPVLDAIKGWEKSVQEARKQAWAFSEEIGAVKGATWQDQRFNVLGFSFEGEVPKGFKHYAKDPKGMFRPDKTAAGKQYAERMKKLRPQDMDQVKRMIGPQMVAGPDGSGRSRTGLVLYCAHWTYYGGVCVAFVPVVKDEKYVPPEGFKPLTLSEHFRLKAAHDAGKSKS